MDCSFYYLFVNEHTQEVEAYTDDMATAQKAVESNKYNEVDCVKLPRKHFTLLNINQAQKLPKVLSLSDEQKKELIRNEIGLISLRQKE